MTKSRTRNRFRLNKDSWEFKAWEKGFEAQSLSDNPFDRVNDKLSKLFTEGFNAQGEDIKEIPQGIYCYLNQKVCPYWGKNPKKPKQMNGYCRFLRVSDWNGTDLLWDQVKSCGVNTEEDFLDYNDHFNSFEGSLSLKDNPTGIPVVVLTTEDTELSIRESDTIESKDKKYDLSFGKKVSVTIDAMGPEESFIEWIKTYPKVTIWRIK